MHIFCYLGKQFYGQVCPTGQSRKKKIVTACDHWFTLYSLASPTSRNSSYRHKNYQDFARICANLLFFPSFFTSFQQNEFNLFSCLKLAYFETLYFKPTNLTSSRLENGRNVMMCLYIRASVLTTPFCSRMRIKRGLRTASMFQSYDSNLT